jgi:hypothetical protein
MNWLIREALHFVSDFFYFMASSIIWRCLTLLRLSRFSKYSQRETAGRDGALESERLEQSHECASGSVGTSARTGSK